GALIAAWVLVGSATEASAGYGYRHHGYGHHGCCGPIRPTYKYNTIIKNKYIRHYKDQYRTKYVKRIHRIVHVTRILPIYHIHTVKRVHTNIVGVVYPVHQWVKHYLPPRKIYTTSVKYYTHCRCSSHGHHGY
ncbi:MAG: hypothetical protein QOE95_2354, partial [Gaiellaceae bacterium]|nr:hypothetical protein [Gaiellaceae bacterium]